MGSQFRENWKRLRGINTNPTDSAGDLTNKADGIDGVPIVGTPSVSGQVLKYTGAYWAPSSDAGGFFSEGGTPTSAVGNGAVAPTNAGANSFAHGSGVAIGSDGNQVLALGSDLTINGSNTLILGDNIAAGTAAGSNGMNSLFVGSDITVTTPYNSIAVGRGLTAMYNSATFGRDNVPGYFSIVGGDQNVSDSSSTSNLMMGSSNNLIDTTYSIIGGFNNSSNNADGNTINGRQNVVAAASKYSSINGRGCIASGTVYSVLGGYLNNLYDSNSSFLGGRQNFASNFNYGFGFGKSNSLNGDYSLIGGSGNSTSNVNRSIINGYNIAATGINDSLITGQNQDIRNGLNQSIVAGVNHKFPSNSNYSIVGGFGNIINNNASAFVVGDVNTSTSSYYSSIIGNENVASSIKHSSIIGHQNTVDNTNYSLVAGKLNDVRTRTKGSIIGGYSNVCAIPVGKTSYGIITGFNNYASGSYHSIFGAYNRIDSDYGFVGGAYNNLNLEADWSIAVGSGNQINTHTTAVFGNQNTSTTTLGFATFNRANFLAGQWNYIKGGYNAAIGKSNVIRRSAGSTAGFCFAIGLENHIYGDSWSTIALGESNTTNDWAQRAFGTQGTLGNESWSAVDIGGYKNTIEDYSQYSLTRGYNNIVRRNSKYSTAIGHNTHVSGNYSWAFGVANRNHSQKSMVFGENNFAEGGKGNPRGFNFVVGKDNVASGNTNFLFGERNSIYHDTNYGAMITLLGRDNVVTGSPFTIFMAGYNQTASTYGHVAIGAQNRLAYGANSYYAMTMGFGNKIYENSPVAMSFGQYNKCSGEYSFAFGSSAHATRPGQFAFGSAKVGPSGQVSMLTNTIDTTSAASGALITLPLDIDRGYNAEIKVVGKEHGVSDSFVTYKLSHLSIYRDSTGDAKIAGMDAIDKIFVGAGTNTDFVITPSAENIILNVKGEAGTTWHWNGTVTFNEVRGAE